MPGIRESLILAGSSLSHLSGFHSVASGPQISVLRFTPTTDTVNAVPLGTTISLNNFPSFPTIGNANGRTVSANALGNIVTISMMFRQGNRQNLHSIDIGRGRISGEFYYCWRVKCERILTIAGFHGIPRPRAVERATYRMKDHLQFPPSQWESLVELVPGCPDVLPEQVESSKSQKMTYLWRQREESYETSRQLRAPIRSVNYDLNCYDKFVRGRWDNIS